MSVDPGQEAFVLVAIIECVNIPGVAFQMIKDTLHSRLLNVDASPSKFIYCELSAITDQGQSHTHYEGHASFNPKRWIFWTLFLSKKRNGEALIARCNYCSSCFDFVNLLQQARQKYMQLFIVSSNKLSVIPTADFYI